MAIVTIMVAMLVIVMVAIVGVTTTRGSQQNC